jgi:hypothetical protein
MPLDDQVTFPPEPVRPSGSGRSLAVRMGIVAGSAVLFVVGAVAAMGASPAPAASNAPDQNSDPAASVAPAASAAAPAASAAPDTTNQGKPTRPDGGKFFGPGGIRGGFGFGGGPGAHGFGDITITGVSGSDVSLKTADGWTRTITVTSDTKITKGGQTIAVSDLAVGDHVVFSQKRNDDGTYTVTAIRVVLPTVGGQVSAIDGSTITITQPGGTTSKIHVSGDTKITVDGKSDASVSDIKVGSFIIAEGTQRSDGSLDAATLHSGAGGPFGKGGPGGPHGGPGKPAAPNASPAPSTSAG